MKAMDQGFTRRLSHILGVLTFGLVLAFSLVLVGCGNSGPKNLEEYVSTEEGEKILNEAKKSADIGDMGTMDIVVKENNILYDVTFSMTFDENPLADGAFDDETISGLSKAIADMEKETGLSGVTMEYIFKDSAGTVLYQVKIDDQGIVK